MAGSDIDGDRARGTGGPPFDPEAVPETAVLSRDRTLLTLTWPNEQRGALSASELRLRCRCAWCTRARIEGTFPASFPDVEITDVKALGTYAVHIAFSDDHARGIFPWVYLRDLADAVPGLNGPGVRGPSREHGIAA